MNNLNVNFQISKSDMEQVKPFIQAHINTQAGCNDLILADTDLAYILEYDQTIEGLSTLQAMINDNSYNLYYYDAYFKTVKYLDHEQALNIYTEELEEFKWINDINEKIEFLEF